MTLVFTNSKRIAIILAAGIDGIVLKSVREKIRFSNLDEYYAEAEHELSSVGYLQTFFRGEAYNIVYANGCPCQLAKMVDYNPEYENMAKWPVPFCPDRLQYKVTDEEYAAHESVYKRLYASATKLINAATDDIEGELAFHQFRERMGGADDFGPKTSRVRPICLSEGSIIEAFNMLESGEARAVYEAAHINWEQLNWIVSCNLTNALTKNNFEKRLMVAGFIESIMLSMMAQKRLQAESLRKNPEYAVTVKSEIPSTSEYLEFTLREAFESKEQAEAAAAALRTAGALTIQTDSIQRTVQNIPLHNILTLTQDAAEPDLCVSGKDTGNALTWLYEGGYITRPSLSTSLPWSMKPLYSKSVIALSRNPKYKDRVQPMDIDGALDWAQSFDTLKQIGLWVTDKPLPAEMPNTARIIYELIAEADITAINAVRACTTRLSNADCCGFELYSVQMDEKLVKKNAAYTKRFAESTPPALPAGEKLDIVEVTVEQKTETECYTEAQLLNDLIAMASDGFGNSKWFYANPLENLITWGCVKRTANNQELEVTPYGMSIYRYLSETMLGDAAESINWLRRLELIAEAVALNDDSKGTTSGEIQQGLQQAEKFREDIRKFTTDLCKSIERTGMRITNLRGHDALLCPICGEEVMEQEKAWCCQSGKCGFRIPKEFHQHQFTAAEVSDIVFDGKTDRIRDFASAKGTFAARVIRDGKKLTLDFSYPLPCPYCAGKIQEYAWGLKCSCGFSLNTTICKHELTESEIEQLLKGETTEQLQLTNSKGKSFVASLSLDEGKKLQFIFPKSKQ